MRLTAVVAALSFGAGALAVAAGADARLEHFDLNIPREGLDGALRDLAEQTGVQVARFSDQSQGSLLVGPLQGSYSPDGALQALLNPTGLAYRALNDRAFIVTAPTSTSTKADRDPQSSAGPSSAGPAPAGSSSTESASQREPIHLEEVVVTGTHIIGVQNRTEPLIVIDRAQIQQTGYSTTQELFWSLPQNFASGDTTPVGIFGNSRYASNNDSFSSGINLRGLGATSTLVLVNGHRVALSATGTSVDVSAIPLAAIERVEIMPSGSSAIYGSDAVGGVVNIILRQDYQGAETSIRYGTVTNGSRHEQTVSQTLGGRWTGGNLVGTLQYQNQSALSAGDRSFASALGNPSDLLPHNRNYAAILDGRQTIVAGLEFSGDLLVSKRGFANAVTSGLPSGDVELTSGGDSRHLTLAPNLQYALNEAWSLELNALYGRQSTHNAGGEIFPGTISTVVNDTFTVRSGDLLLSGHFPGTRAGNIGVAAGGSYRREDLDATSTTLPGPPIPLGGGRHVIAGYAELYAPLVGAENQITFVRRLDISVAARVDHYSDFGSTTNPRLGLYWAPGPDVAVRASYGRSFRAPSETEAVTAFPANQLAYTYDVASPTGSGTVPALILTGGKPLTAERARVYDYGVEFRPRAVQDLRLTLDYYDVLYKERIGLPPVPFNLLQIPGVYGPLISPLASDADAREIVNQVVNAGGTFVDAYGNGIAGVRYLYDDRMQNIGVVRQSGLDFSASFVKSLGAHTLTSRLELAYIDRIDTQYTPTSPSNNQVNTFGNPVRWRGRLTSTWDAHAWAVSGAVNYVGHYINDTLSPTFEPISSWTTVDCNATLRIDALSDSPAWRHLSLSVSGINIFNRTPPYVDASQAFVSVNFDPANASPLGRFLALTVQKGW